MGAGLGAAIGDTVAGREVVGVAEGRPRCTSRRGGAAARRAPGAVDAVGVLAEPGVPVDTLHARVRAALDEAGLKDTAAGRPLRALTGDGRGGAEHLGAPPARAELLELLAAVAANVVLVAVLVLASLVAQALQQRAAEREMLLSAGATPRQVRGAAGREVTRVAGVAALLGVLVSGPVFLALWSMLRARTGVVPEGLELPLRPGCSSPSSPSPSSWWASPVSWCSSRCADRGTRAAGARAAPAVSPGSCCSCSARARPVRPRSRAATRRGGRRGGRADAGRRVRAARAVDRGAAMAVLDRPFRRLGGAPGRLTAAGAAAHSRRLGAALVPVVLVTAFALVQLSAGATVERAAAAQARAATTADLAFTGTTAEHVRRLPGCGRPRTCCVPRWSWPARRPDRRASTGSRSSAWTPPGSRARSTRASSPATCPDSAGPARSRWARPWPSPLR
ncbi:hypothetical protein O1L60_17070 [Streptomyces diastatochromogenes]|nr:hypothetical protein [Streptomyces diastatochromogenes]